MKQMVMKEAWDIARKSANMFGGKKVEWIAYGLTKAWKKFKEGKLAQRSVEQVKVMKGRMTEKQESFITSLLRKKATDNPTAQAFNVSSLRSRISKQQASDLINELLAA